MSQEAYVLWLDMLGYKNWLFRQEELESAENSLVQALRTMHSTMQGEPSKLTEYGISTLLISDTVIFWTYRDDIDALLGLCVCYHTLATELAKFGLPVRGALARGGLRVRESEPRTIIGKAIVYCATTEQSLNCFAVRVHDSVLLHWMKDAGSEELHAVIHLFFQHVSVSTKFGEEKIMVLKWKLATIPGLLARLFQRTRERAKTDPSALADLMAFCPKLLGSQEMFSTIDEDTLYAVVKREWDAAIADAGEALKILGGEVAI